MDVHEVLCKARNLLDKNGWVQEPAYGRGGTYCAMGALSAGAGNGVGDLWHAASRAMDGAVGTWALDEWNDTPGRTKQEVLEAFDKAIAATAPEPQDPLAGVSLDFSPEAVAMP